MDALTPYLPVQRAYITHLAQYIMYVCQNLYDMAMSKIFME